MIKNNQDAILFFVIITELFYIIINFKSNIITNFRVKNIFGKVYFYKILIVILFIFFSILFSYIISAIFKTNILLSFIFITCSFILYIEYKLKINTNISNKIINIKENNYFNTGDIIIFETPKNIETLFSVIPVLVININHIGIVLKDANKKILILESEHTEQYCNYSNRIKNGVMLLDLEDRLKMFDNCYLVKTSLHKYINQDELVKFIEKYKDKEYMEDNINCITLVSSFLKELKLIKNDNNISLYTDYKYFLNNTNYTNEIDIDIYKISAL
jgi:hypothetical protein